jgi:hypothetical protein
MGSSRITSAVARFRSRSNSTAVRAIARAIKNRHSPSQHWAILVIPVMPHHPTIGMPFLPGPPESAAIDQNQDCAPLEGCASTSRFFWARPGSQAPSHFIALLTTLNRGAARRGRSRGHQGTSRAAAADALYGRKFAEARRVG